MEETNARFITKLPEPVALVTVDASFISLRVLLPAVKGWLGMDAGQSAGGIVMLIKPQFEAGRGDVRRGRGVIREAQIHQQVLLDVLTFAGSQGLGVRGLERSPLLGPKGNVEFLAWLAHGAAAPENLHVLIEAVCALPAPAQK
jgi:23S rRNA (cytidine1920-2'-O)/16S rRNA (cytidine1409-2'-O)-methyltransferase